MSEELGKPLLAYRKHGSLTMKYATKDFAELGSTLAREMARIATSKYWLKELQHMHYQGAELMNVEVKRSEIVTIEDNVYDPETIGEQVFGHRYAKYAEMYAMTLFRKPDVMMEDDCVVRQFETLLMRVSSYSLESFSRTGDNLAFRYMLAPLLEDDELVRVWKERTK